MNPILEQRTACPRCGAPIFNVKGKIISSCVCGKLHEQKGMGAAQGAASGLEQFGASKDSNVIVYEALREIIANECTTPEGHLSSHGKFPFAKALKIMEAKGDINIIVERGPMIKAQWK